MPSMLLAGSRWRTRAALPRARFGQVLRSMGLLLAMLVLAGIASSRSATRAGSAIVGPKTYYVALGDSIAYGSQPAGSNVPSYVDDIASALAPSGPSQLIDMSCPGETSTTFVQGGCPHQNLVRYPYTGSQLATAVQFIHQHPGQVSPVTLDIGYDDQAHDSLFNLLPCSLAAGPTLAASLARYDANLATAFSQLQGALAGSGDLLVMTNYTAHQNECPVTNALQRVYNDRLVAAAHQAGAIVVPVYDAFNSTNVPSPHLCAYTWICGGYHNIHPNAAGDTVIASLFLSSAGYPTPPTFTATPTANGAPTAVPTATAPPSVTPLGPTGDTHEGTIVSQGGTDSFSFMPQSSGPATITSCTLTPAGAITLSIYDQGGTLLASGAAPAICNEVTVVVTANQPYTVTTVASVGSGAYRAAWSVNGSQIAWYLNGTIADTGGSQTVQFPALRAAPLSVLACGPPDLPFGAALLDGQGTPLAGATPAPSCQGLSSQAPAPGLYQVQETSSCGGAWSGLVTADGPTQTVTSTPSSGATATLTATPSPTVPAGSACATGTLTATASATAGGTATATPTPTSTSTAPFSGTFIGMLAQPGQSGSYGFTAGVNGRVTVGSCSITAAHTVSMALLDASHQVIGGGGQPAYCNWASAPVVSGAGYTVSTTAVQGTGEFISAWSVGGAPVTWPASGTIVQSGGTQSFSFATLSTAPISASVCGPAGTIFGLDLTGPGPVVLAGSHTLSNCQALTYAAAAHGLYRLRISALAGSGAWSGTVTADGAATPMATATATATATSSQTVTVTPSDTPSTTPSQTATSSDTPSSSPSAIPSASATPSSTPAAKGPLAGSFVGKLVQPGQSGSYTFTPAASGTLSVESCSVTSANSYMVTLSDQTRQVLARGASDYCSSAGAAVNAGQQYIVTTSSIRGTGEFRSAWSVDGAQVSWQGTGTIATAGGAQSFSFVIPRAAPIAASMCGPADTNFDLQLTGPGPTVLAQASGPTNCQSLSYTPATPGLYRLRVLAVSGSGAWSASITS